MPFNSFAKALHWARTYAREHCHAHQTWRVVKAQGRCYKVAVFSRNTGDFSHFATA